MTGINVIGMPFGMHGLGIYMREQVKALQSAGLDVCVINRNYSSLKREVRDPEIAPLIAREPKYDTNLICHGLPATGLIARDTPELFEGRHNIGAPFWEFPQLPERHSAGLEYLDEIWVSTTFLRGCFAPHTEAPVKIMPLPLDVPPPPRKPKRTKVAPLTFGYVFDFNSMVARKDPMLLLTAFLECFADKPAANVQLVIKYKVEPAKMVRQRDVDDLIALAGLDARIKLIDAPLSSEDMNALYDSFDVYISPHRAEGLGLGIIEAMLKGKGVAATAYSGPAEFLSPEYSIPLEYDQTHVGAAALGDIKSYFTWADARLESVMGALSTFAQTPGLAAKMGSKAQKHLALAHGRENHGRACAERLLELRAR